MKENENGNVNQAGVDPGIAKANKQAREDMLSQLIRAHFLKVEFRVKDEEMPHYVHIMELNRVRYVRVSDLPGCRKLREWTWSAPHFLMVMDEHTHKVAGIMPLSVLEENKDYLHFVSRKDKSVQALLERALQAAGVDPIPGKYNHIVSDVTLDRSERARLMLKSLQKPRAGKSAVRKGADTLVLKLGQVISINGKTYVLREEA